MIEQELILLGLLRQSPRHGYEIKTNVRQILSLFAGVELKSIYYPLKVLEKKGLLTKRVGKAGRRPERFVYSLTPQGKKRFEELLNKSLLVIKRPQFSLDLSLYFLHYLKPASARRRLRGRLNMLNKLLRGMEKMARSKELQKTPALSRILEHNLRLLKAEESFLESLLNSQWK